MEQWLTCLFLIKLIQGESHEFRAANIRFLEKSLISNFYIKMFELFHDFSPAVFVRNLAQTLIQPYANPQQQFQSSQLRQLLTEVFKYRQFEVSYELMKVLSYGKNKYISIALEQLVNYFMEKHLGENTVNNYAYRNGYARREEKIMNKSQFLETLALGLSHFETFHMSQYTAQFQGIFDVLDKNKTGTIPQSLYCEFLRYYFGSESPMAINPTQRITQISESQQLISQNSKPQISQKIPESSVKSGNAIESNKFYLSNKEITAQSLSNQSLKLSSALDEFHDLIVSEIKLKCQEYDENKDGFLNKKDSQKFLYEVLELEYNSIDFILASYFNFSRSSLVSYSELIEIVCEVHFREILSTIIKGELKNEFPSKIYMEKEYFISKILQNCYFFSIKPSEDLIGRVYEELLLKSDNRQDEKLSLQDFRSYILVHCCNNKLIFRHHVKKSTHNLIPPDSIMEVENSHFEQDESENDQFRLSRKQFEVSHKSISKEQEAQSRQSLQGERGLSSNKQTKKNKLSEEDISSPNQLFVPDNPVVISSKQVHISALDTNKQSLSSIKLIAGLPPSSHKMLPKEKDSQRPFKEILWTELETLVSKYCVTLYGKISKEECYAFFNNQSLFQNDRLNLKNKIIKLYLKQSYIDTEILIGFIIHAKGEDSLIKFNKNQIKGKSTLNQKQITEILYSAFGSQLNLKISLFQQFSKLLFIQNGKSLFLYKNYLQLVARNLSIKNNF